MIIFLYLVIIFIIILFVYSFLIKKDYFSDIRNYDLNKLSFPKFNQDYEFVPKDNFTYIKDSKFINQYDNYLSLGKIEYQNLGTKIYEKEKLPMPESNVLERNKNFIEKLDRITDYPLLKREISLIEFDNILTTLKLKHKYNNINDLNLKEQRINKELYSFNLIKEWIIEQISLEADKELYRMKFINNERFRYIEDTILKYKTNGDIDNFIFKMRVYRDNKFNHFIVYFDLLFDKKQIKYYIKNIVILGTDIQENIDFSNYKQNFFGLSNKFNSNVKYSKEEIDKFLNSKKKKDIAEFDTSYCFFKPARNKTECISPKKDDYSLGIWDERCLVDEDCPFYKKNINYPNNRGGCKDGFCEMPVNIKRIGFKQYITGNEPVCYNCKRENCSGLDCNLCCEKQKDKDKYPNLNSPDYAFPNDFNQRLEHSKLFFDKNLSPVSLIA